MVKLFKYKISTLEIFTMVIFTFYLIFNVQTPTFLLGIVDSLFGIIILMILVLCLFLYTNPILGILGLYVAYEMIRRSTMMVSGHVPMIQYTPTQIMKDRHMVEMNLPKAFEQFDENEQNDQNEHDEHDEQKESSLEMELIESMAPLMNTSSNYIETSFKPVSENIHSASLA